jgi:hypothetical protein
VVRRATNIKGLGVKNFKPDRSRHEEVGFSDANLSLELKEKLEQVFPDLIAAAKAATYDFDAETAIEIFASLETYFPQVARRI